MILDASALLIDATATEHIFHIQGIGRMRHIDVAEVWLQDEARSRRLTVRRVKNEHNLADLGDKAVGRAVIAACRNPGQGQLRSIWPVFFVAFPNLNMKLMFSKNFEEQVF